MTAPRIARREMVLITITALVCFAIAIPLTRASADHAQRQFTVWPGNSARFANLDWNCEYLPAGSVTTKVPALTCGRESTERGLRVSVTGDIAGLFTCQSLQNCKRIALRPRTP